MTSKKKLDCIVTSQTDNENPDSNSKPIGRVSSTTINPSSTYSFQFLTDTNEPLNISDVVKVEVDYIIGKGKSYTFAIITGMNNISDAPDHITNYVSSNFGQLEKSNDNTIERLTFNCIEARVVTNSEDINTPVKNGALVFTCDTSEIQKHIFNVDVEKDKDYIPFGYLTMYGGSPIGCLLPKRSILGPEAVHVNLSGVSGRAAKTTTAMCILSAIQKRLEKDVAFILFNVKGEDLLYLNIENTNKPNNKQTQSRTDYNKAFSGNTKNGVPEYANKFNPDTIKYFIPVDAKQNNLLSKKKIEYCALYQEEKQNLDLLFADYPDDYGTIESFLTANKETTWETFFASGETIPTKQTKDKICRILKTLQEKFTLQKNDQKITQAASLSAIEDNNLFSGVSVIDVHTLNHFEQAFVIGTIIRKAQNYMKSNNHKKNVIIFADELNQFAPKGMGNRSVICQMLVDIAARGRTDGIILFTAEQFLSKVDDQVVDNCSVKIYGHTNMGELSDFKYSHLPNSIKHKITSLQPGHCILDSADLATPIEIQFPYPSYSLGKPDGNANGKPDGNAK